MAQPTLLSIAKADLITAERCVDSENKHIKHHAAYHTEQAIEKTLKFLIEAKKGSFPWGHDIAKLVYEAEKYGIMVPKEIKDNADVYTEWEVTSRYYPQKAIRRDTIKKAINITKEWHESKDMRDKNDNSRVKTGDF